MLEKRIILAYLQKSCIAHTINEPEESLSSVASFDGIAKDYLQALSDEGKIHVEKIGSKNWH